MHKFENQLLSLYQSEMAYSYFGLIAVIFHCERPPSFYSAEFKQRDGWDVIIYVFVAY